MHVLIVGYGSIGKRHVAAVRHSAPTSRVTVLRLHGREPVSEADQTCFTLDEAFAMSPALAVICGPASTHLVHAREAVARGIPVLVEKPISHEQAGVKTLIRRCAENHIPAAVAYNFRFHPGIQALQTALAAGAVGSPLFIRAEVGQYLPDWRPGRDYRTTVTAQAALGGGAILELSHEIDLVRHLLGEVVSVQATAGHVSNLEIDTEDVADLQLRFANGLQGSIHLDLLQRPPSRWCTVIGTEGTLRWDGIAQTVTHYTPDAPQGTCILDASTEDRQEMYNRQMAHILHCIQTGDAPAVPLQDGARVLDIALAAKRSSRSGQRISL